LPVAAAEQCAFAVDFMLLLARLQARMIAHDVQLW
jgi:hypothetical protein